ncbi:MAG TPA: hypothetical protein VFV99_20980 [Kofleriaceae bacterium]|nr:hypothetical protein [Kofleriaceae bacterium]
MRWLVFAIAITSSTVAAAGDGYFVAESLGGAGYRGELGRYDGAPRWQAGFDIRRGDWTVELFGMATIPDLFFIDCYGEECAYAAKPQAGLGGGGVDIKKRWQLLYLHRWGKPGVYERPGLFASLHGGARWFVGTEALDGYAGPGLGAGASLEGDVWVIGYYLDVGIDIMTLNGPDDTIHGSAPYIALGGKFGWL